MVDLIPAEVRTIYDKLIKSGFEAYFIGGCVRNLLLKREIKDWDLTTNATPEELQKIFPDSFYENAFGTVGVPLAKDKIVEITTYRKEDDYSDNRHPEKVSWGKTIEDDLGRRDFTINAIAAKIKNEKLEYTDPFNGREDLDKKIVKAVGDPAKRFKEDSLRLIRAVRIATELDFKIDESTWNEILKDSTLLSNVSNERIKTELLRILSSNFAYEGIILLKDSNLLKEIIPELLEGIGVSQKRPGRHHTEDVFTHNVLSLKHTTSTDSLVRFATLIHDIGKPRVAKNDEEGLVIFHNHEVVGAQMAEEITDRLRFSKKEQQKIVNLVRWHMFTIDENITDSAIRRFIRRVGVENVKDMIDLRIGDRLGGGTQVAESWRLKLFKERIEKELKPGPFSINDMKIDGNDIVKELKISPGPLVGKIINVLFEEVDEDLSKNTKEYLTKRLKELDLKKLEQTS